MVIYKRGGGFEFETTERQIQQVTGAGHEPGTPRVRVRRADPEPPDTLPPCYAILPIVIRISS